MDRIFNQFSFIIGGLLLLIVAALLLARRKNRVRNGLLLGILVLLLATAWVVLHPSGQAVTADQIRQQIGAGSPVLLEFLSPY
ncbi:MAG: LPXTG cell wall anchor domain-containing protein [Bellilinea sp.]